MVVVEIKTRKTKYNKLVYSLFWVLFERYNLQKKKDIIREPIQNKKQILTNKLEKKTF